MVKKKTYNVTKIFRSGKHWTDPINGKTKTMEKVRELIDVDNIEAVIVSYTGKYDGKP